MRPRVGIRELRDHLTATIRRVRAGETLEITHEGEPVALLVPFPRGRIERLLAGGDVSAATPLARPLRRFPVAGTVDASDALAEDRAET